MWIKYTFARISKFMWIFIIPYVIYVLIVQAMSIFSFDEDYFSEILRGKSLNLITVITTFLIGLNFLIAFLNSNSDEREFLKMVGVHTLLILSFALIIQLILGYVILNPDSFFTKDLDTIFQYVAFCVQGCLFLPFMTFSEFLMNQNQSKTNTEILTDGIKFVKIGFLVSFIPYLNYIAFVVLFFGFFRIGISFESEAGINEDDNKEKNLETSPHQQLESMDSSIKDDSNKKNIFSPF